MKVTGCLILELGTLFKIPVLLIMNINELKQLLADYFPYIPTPGQQELINKLAVFSSDIDQKSLFILKGYAGTGKTTIVSSLVKACREVGIKTVLMAPTGRAANVLSSYSGKRAYTIHMRLYWIFTKNDGSMSLQLGQNQNKDTLFIVDEASMIPDSSIPTLNSLFPTQRILDELIFYTYQGHNCRLLLIGDSAQLPPVGLNISPALDIEYIKNSYSLNVRTHELTEVVRQEHSSAILSDATGIREMIRNELVKFPLFPNVNNIDLCRINGIDLEEEINSAYSKYGIDNTVIICRSNKRANLFNREIRGRILFREGEISTSDIMMIVRNNYFWLDEESKTGFLANGEIFEILRVNKYEEKTASLLISSC